MVRVTSPASGTRIPYVRKAAPGKDHAVGTAHDSPSGQEAGHGPAPGHGPEQGGHDQRWPALAVCLTAGFMTLLDVSIVNVALPSIRNGIDASQSGLQWVLSGYALTFGLALVPAGRIGDVHSRRAVFITGLALFTATSALAGAAQNETWLVAARLLQGAAGGILVPQMSGFIQQMFRGAERGRAFGLLGATIGVSTAVGPLLGGLLIQAFGTQDGWRWVFYVNLPIGLATLPLAYRLLPGPPKRAAGAVAASVRRSVRPSAAPWPQSPAGRDHPRPAQDEGIEDEPATSPGKTRRRSDLDPMGVLLLGVGTVVLLLPFVQEQQWKGAQKWLLVPLALLVLGAFVLWERRYAATREPLVDLRLFRQRSFGLGVLLSLLYFTGFTAIFFLLTLYLQNGEQYSALEAGLSIMPFAVGSGASAAVGGRIVTRIGRPLVAIGLLMVVIGLLGTALAVHLASGHYVGWATAAPLLFAGIGSG
ncbi:MAG: hypothetical protein QOF98_3790, partial [Streptomyces sp.]|nr:hypothetical protein [Streptomyces sp.]